MFSYICEMLSRKSHGEAYERKTAHYHYYYYYSARPTG